MSKLLRYLPSLVVLALPALASAHEVYVLTPGEITYGATTPPFDMLQVISDNLHQFIFWGFITFVVISTIFCISIFRRFETMLFPFFAWGKRYAHDICRITVGLGFLAGAYYQASYGPELPLTGIYGAAAPLVAGLIGLLGIMLLFGVWVRAAAFTAIVLFGVATVFNGSYMFTYSNYVGEFIVLLLLGAHKHKRNAGHQPLGLLWRRIERTFAPYSFLVIRVGFGVSLLYASLYAKILHNNLALQVAELPLAGHEFGVAHYLGFEPHFLVLGAAIVEIIVAVFFIVGFEIRWTSLFLEFWLALSLIFFGEVVWPHLILIGIPIAFFFYGYDRYSVEGRFFKKHHLEPVL